MDVVAAHTAVRAWHSLPAAVRREVVTSSRQGRAAPDPTLAQRAVDWGRSEYPLAYAWALILGTALAVCYGAWRYPATSGAVIAIRAGSTMVVLALLGWTLNRHRGARRAAQVNLRAQVAADAYEPRTTLEVRAVTWPWWYLPGVVLLPAGLIGWTWWSEPDRHHGREMLISLAFFAVFLYLLRWARRGRTVPRFALTGGLVFALGPPGLRLPDRDRTVPWTEVIAADVAFDGPPDRWPLSIAFTLRDPDRTLMIPVHWLDQDPGVILATARRYLAAAQSQLPTT